jgi:hypothetical protein
MRISRRGAVALLTTVALAGSAGATATSAVAAPRALLNSAIAPSVPTDPMLHGVTAGGAPWVIKKGLSFIHLLNNGELQVKIKGLVIPELGTPGPVTSVDASLYCANETTPAATTATFPLSKKGNAMIEETIVLPSKCLTPVVLINPLGIDSIYIATSGFVG